MQIDSNNCTHCRTAVRAFTSLPSQVFLSLELTLMFYVSPNHIDLMTTMK